jgi:hypothetical protein
MKVKNFKDYLDQRLDKKEIADIERAAQLEYETLRMLQEDIAKATIKYMSDNNLGFNDLVKKMGKSPSHISKIIKGEANLTLATVAQLYALIGRKAHIVSI